MPDGPAVGVGTTRRWNPDENEKVRPMIYSDWILVGVDGSRGSAAAVRYAAREARRRDLGLRLAHVVPPRVQLAPVYAGFELSNEGIAAAAQEVLTQSAGLALDLISLGQLSTVVLDGERADALSSEADRAALVVLGDQRRTRREVTPTRWTCDQVVAHSTSPVVLVPAGWSPAHEHGDVVAGVSTPADSRDVIRTAMEEAHRRSVRLRLIHAARPTDGTSGEPDVWAEESALKDASKAFGAEFPHVDVSVRTADGCPVELVRSASADAALVVLQRPSGDDEHSRTTIRTLLQGSGCPVEFLGSPAPVPVPVTVRAAVLAT